MGRCPRGNEGSAAVTGGQEGGAQSTVRVELFGNPNAEDYENLHAKMQSHDFYRVLRSGDGEWYHLPNATYDHSSTETKSTVRDTVWTIARSVWNKPGALVTESDGRAGQGLKKASQDEVEDLTS